MSRILGVFAALLLLGAALPARALDYTLVDFYVCNKGTVPVEAIYAEKYDAFLGIPQFWDIRGQNLAAGKCDVVYASGVGHPAYLAFGFVDAKGQWGSGQITHVPDYGDFSQWFRSQKILIGASQPVCVHQDQTRYVADGDIPTDCAGLTLTSNRPDVGHGPFVRVTAALYLETVGQTCTDRGIPSPCDYYLNISPTGSDWDLHAVMGTSSGKDVTESPEDSRNAATIRFLRALAKAALEEHENEAKAAADAAEAHRQYLMEQPAAREKQQKQILAAAAAGDPDAKVPAQMIEREAENNRQRWGAGTRQSPAAFDPQWTGHNVAIVGTVSRVDIDPSGSPQWVSIYFKESPDAAFVVCSPYQDLFQERVGMNLSVLVGKTMEAAGQVESPHCGQKTSRGSIRVVESTQWQLH